MSDAQPSERPPVRVASIGVAVLAVVLTCLAALHGYAVFTENINWDEFALMFRATETIRTDIVHGGGRHGLATLALLPVVDGCSDGTQTVRVARVIWLVMTFASLAALALMLRRSEGPRSRPSWHRVALAIGMLVLVPVWLRWSLQVRTDQMMLALSLWGGVALLASERRMWLAALAGVLSMAGFLATQKGLYISALVGVIALGQHYIARTWNWRRELYRVGWLGAGAIATYTAFKLLVGALFSPQLQVHSVSAGMSVFDFYRQVLGWKVYRDMVPTLYPQLAVIALLIVLSGYALYERFVTKTTEPRIESARHLVVAWGVFGLGLAVTLFHAARFPYFWMTLGLFVAVLLFYVSKPAAEAFGKARTTALVVAALWVALIIPALGQSASLAVDTQAIQRSSLAFIERNFEPTDHGFHPEGALFCRDDPEPFPTYFSQHIALKLRSNPQEQREFIARFRNKPVKFIVESHRLAQFPRPIRAMFFANYVRFHPGVQVPGFRLGGPAGTKVRVDNFVAGRFRFRTGDPESEARLRVAGNVIESGEEVDLPTGQLVIELLDPVPAATLAYAVDQYREESDQFFYSLEMFREFSGTSTR